MARDRDVEAADVDGDAAATRAAAPPERFYPYGRRPLRTFALTIGLPAFLLYVSSAVLAMLALVMMAREMDRLEDLRGVNAVNAALESVLNGMSDAVGDESAWNDAYLNVIVEPNPAWMDASWAATARLGTTYDEVLVTNQDGKIIFGENMVGPVSGNIAEHYPAAPAMLEALNASISTSGDASVVANFAKGENGVTAMAAASIHKTTPGEMTVPRHQRRVLWISRRMTSSTLADLSVQYHTPVLELVTAVPTDYSSITFADAKGSPTGTVAWVPDRPGETAVNKSLITVSLAFLGLGALIVIGLGLMRRAIVKAAAKADQAHYAFLLHHTAEKIEAVDDEPAHVEAGPAQAQFTALSGVNMSDFALDYQPVFDMRAERIVGVEALLRWTRHDKSRLLQEELSQTELATAIDRVAIMELRQALGDVAPLLGISLSLAITPAQLLNGVFVEKVIGTLGAMNFPAARLQLCLDSRTLPAAETLAAPIGDLRRMGVGITLNHFALDVSTLDVLRLRLADRATLSPPLAEGINDDPTRLKLIETSIEAARAASLEVAVAGVERRDDVARLLRLGCREFRSPLFAAPMGIAAVTALVLAPAPAAARQAG